MNHRLGWTTLTRGDEAEDLVRFQNTATVSKWLPKQIPELAIVARRGGSSPLTSVSLCLASPDTHASGPPYPPVGHSRRLPCRTTPKRRRPKPRLGANGSINGRRWRVSEAGNSLEETSQRDEDTGLCLLPCMWCGMTGCQGQ
jgi:hypothetical protein